MGLARALVGRPDILLADEPTAQLDSVTAAWIMDLITELVEASGIVAVVATRHAAMAARATRIWTSAAAGYPSSPCPARRRRSGRSLMRSQHRPRRVRTDGTPVRNQTSRLTAQPTKARQLTATGSLLDFVVCWAGGDNRRAGSHL